MYYYLIYPTINNHLQIEVIDDALEEPENGAFGTGRVTDYGEQATNTALENNEFTCRHLGRHLREVRSKYKCRLV
ncbi:hypothetical protein CCMA1212_006735 [Trichoderma ghanense]|uniref:Uncharacterized protein n=1 Tax=Trichoderma ghanense TaxID=65468 RepID=A0ABY2H2N7_9HYPO